MKTHDRQQFEPDFLDYFNGLEKECNGKVPISLLLDGYAATLDKPFFCYGESFPRLSNHDLGMWIDWCNYYGRPRSEYPLARRLYPDMPEFTGMDLPEGAVV